MFYFVRSLKHRPRTILWCGGNEWLTSQVFDRSGIVSELRDYKVVGL